MRHPILPVTAPDLACHGIPRLLPSGEVALSPGGEVEREDDERVEGQLREVAQRGGVGGAGHVELVGLAPAPRLRSQKELFIDTLLVRIHYLIAPAPDLACHVTREGPGTGVTRSGLPPYRACSPLAFSVCVCVCVCVWTHRAGSPLAFSVL